MKKKIEIDIIKYSQYVKCCERSILFILGPNLAKNRSFLSKKIEINFKFEISVIELINVPNVLILGPNLPKTGTQNLLASSN